MNPQVHAAIASDRIREQRATNESEAERWRTEGELVARVTVADSEAWRHIKGWIEAMQAEGFTNCAIAEGVDLFRWQGEVRVLEELLAFYENAHSELEASRREASE
jgi:hypothetical protein